MSNPELARTPEIRAAAEAQNALFELHAKLVNEFRLEYDFVRLEWAPILNPTPEELELCQKLAKAEEDKDWEVVEAEYSLDEEDWGGGREELHFELEGEIRDLIDDQIQYEMELEKKQ